MKKGKEKILKKAEVKRARGQALEGDFQSPGRRGKAAEKMAQQKQPEASRWTKLGNQDHGHRGTHRDQLGVGNFRVIRKG